MSFIETVDLKCYMVTQPSHPSTLANHPKMRARVQICFEFFKDACWSLENKIETCREQKFPRLFFLPVTYVFFFSVFYFYPSGPEFILGSFHTLGEGQCKISKDPDFGHNWVTAPNCLRRLNSQSWDGQFGVMSERLWGVCPKNSGRKGSWKLVQTIWNDSAT